METITHKGRHTFSEYKFFILSKDDFLDAEVKSMPEGMTHLFMLTSSDDDKSIGSVQVIGVTKSKQSVIDQINSFHISHVAYVDYNPFFQRPYIEESLILEFKPKEIWFLDGKIKLVYMPQISKE